MTAEPAEIGSHHSLCTRGQDNLAKLGHLIFNFTTALRNAYNTQKPLSIIVLTRAPTLISIAAFLDAVDALTTPVASRAS